MNAKKLFFQAILAVTGLYGCAFEPHKEFVSPIKPPEAITVTFELNDPVLKYPYYLLEPTNFHIILHDTSYPLIGSEVTVNGSVIPSWVQNNRDLYFLLDPYQIAYGYHTVSVSCYLDTKSGSLANMAGMENYLVEQAFEIRIDPTPPVFDTFTAEIENGYLTFRWKNQVNHQNYRYIIHRDNGLSFIYPDTIINDPLVNHFIDYGYLGGNLNYNIITRGFHITTGVGEGSVYHEPADFIITRSLNGQGELSWTHRKFAGENQELHIRPQFYFNEERKAPFTPSGKIDLGHIHLGHSFDISVGFYSLTNINRKNAVVVEYRPKPNIRPFTFYALLSKSKKLLVGNSEMLFRYSLEDDMKLEDSLRYSDLGLVWPRDIVVVSPDESRIYISGIGKITESKFISADPHNFDDIQHYVMNSKLSAINFPVGHSHPLITGNASNDGLVTLKAGSNSLLFDIPNQKVIWNSTHTRIRPPAISADGKFLALNLNQNEGWVFEIREGEAHPLGRIDPGYPIFLNERELMTSLHPTRINESDASHITIFDLSNPPADSNSYLTRLRSGVMPTLIDLYSAYYDPSSGYIAFSYPDQLKLYNVITMQFEKTYMGFSLYTDKYRLSQAGFVELAP
ncbi:MAG TPA: hypothetical protein VK957_04405 [Lunatimonas sp.]|nr:hypothetical protein [Lunatimonas sp.]